MNKIAVAKKLQMTISFTNYDCPKNDVKRFDDFCQLLDFVIFVSICLHRARFLKYAVSWLGNVYLFYSAEVKTFKPSGAKSVFLNLSRDKLKNSYMAPLRGVYDGWESLLEV